MWWLLLLSLCGICFSAPVSDDAKDHEKVITNLLDSYNGTIEEWKNQTSMERAMLTFMVNVASDFDRSSETRIKEIFNVIRHIYEEEDGGEEKAMKLARFFVTLYDMLGHIASKLGPEAKVFMQKTVRLVVEPSFLNGTDEERREQLQFLLKGFMLSAVKTAVIAETKTMMDNVDDPSWS